MPLANVTLDDKYTAESGRVFMTGMQALVRLPMLQRQRDLAAGLNTAGYISGYRGSPLGGYDTALARAAEFLRRHHIHFQPGVNEDLAATAVWGTQQVNLWPGGHYDGVFSIWYGKGPGVDRSGDAIKHGNINGTARHGGVLALAGDDHGCKSSTLAHQSEPAFMAASIPILNPAGVQEYLDFGLYGFAMSRYSGCWVGFKCVGDTVESSATVSIDPSRVEIRLPEDFELPEGGLGIRNPDPFVGQEARLLDWKLPAAQAFVRANGLNRIVTDAPKARLGIVTTGKAYLDVRQAFDELGLDQVALAGLGIRLYKVALVWPLEPEGVRMFAAGLEEILVVEEKRGLIEDQLKKLLYNQPNTPRLIVGKRDEDGCVLLPESGEISPAMVARVIVGRLRRHHERPEFDQRLARLDQIEAIAEGQPARLLRHAYFCSGCPHNSSTRVPDGSRAMAGIGCHGMALYVPERRTETITHMGGEGANWIGQAPFTRTRHVFQNLGDGTYFHSGLMAIRAAVAANVSITYKILFNDAVAMTGGQPHDGPLSPWRISQQVHAEGVARVVVVTDEPDKYAIGTDWAPGVAIHHRDELDEVQRGLREISGVTVLIYDQTCAAEKRRRRKRGTFPDPDRRVFINDLVCEDCADCSVQSNCVSVEPLETEWGRTRRINQSACNKDFSCLKGFCPSFVTVEGGRIRRAATDVDGSADLDPATLPEPEVPPASEPFGILITGIGGSGVVTVGQLLGMAAHLEGKAASVLDMTGLAQKNGAVMSHVRIADEPEDLHAVTIATGGARTVLGCDIVVASAQDVLACVTQGVTRAVINSDLTPTPSFVLDPGVEISTAPMEKRIRDGFGDEKADFVAATRLATLLLGDAIATNLFMVGYAYQKGLLPLGAEALLAAIELNGVAIDENKRAFALGRLAAHDAAAVWEAARPLLPDERAGEAGEDLASLIERRAAYLAGYQDQAYGARFGALVARVAAAETARAKGLSGLTEAVARNLFRLMTYKDEYEVARLYTSGDFEAKLARQFEDDYRVKFHLAPPLLARRDPLTGDLQKREFGPWAMPAFRLLARMRRWRGTAFDIFGRTEERRQERQWIADYEALVEAILETLAPDNHALAVRVAEVPSRIRGFGHVKARNMAAAKTELAELVALYRNPTARASAAE